MIILITCYELDKKGNNVEIVSHGVNSRTGRNICLPCEPLSYYIQEANAIWSADEYAWLLPQDEIEKNMLESKNERQSAVRLAHRVSLF
jgi:hypothetical protein